MREKWLHQAIIYHIMIDRFAGEFTCEWDRPNFVGGTLGGIVSRLDWIADLGATALLLSPFCATNDYHGYHTVDYRTVDARFGGIVDFRTIIKECQRRNMKIIMDIVLNHCHENHLFFKEARESPGSPLREWFSFASDGSYEAYLGHSWMPKFNLDHPAARAYMIDTVIFWLDQGISGFRLDYAIGLSHDFLRELVKAANEKHPDCIFIAEAAFSRKDLRDNYDTIRIKHKLRRRWLGFDQDEVQLDYCDILDGVLDFSFRDLMALFVRGLISERRLKRLLDKHFKKYPENMSLALFLDSHDHDRLIANCLRNSDIASAGLDAIKDKMAQAIEIMVEYARRFKQPIIMYYGTEVLLPQVAPKADGYPHSDLVSRRSMDWNWFGESEVVDFRERVKCCLTKRWNNA